MNLERIDEVQQEQVELNLVLASWDITNDEDDYYSLKDTLSDMLSYIIGSTDTKPEVNPLVVIYLDASAILAKVLYTKHLKLKPNQVNYMWEQCAAHYKQAWVTIAEGDLETGHE